MLGILLTPLWPSVIKELERQKEIRREDQLLIGDARVPSYLIKQHLFRSDTEQECLHLFILCLLHKHATF